MRGVKVVLPPRVPRPYLDSNIQDLDVLGASQMISQVHLCLNVMANADIRKKRNALDTGPRNVDEIALFIPKRQVGFTSKQVEALFRNKLNGSSLATPMVFASNDTSSYIDCTSNKMLIGHVWSVH